MDRLATLLDLDTYQKTQVQRVFEEEHTAMDASREQLAASGEQQPSFEQMRARRDQVHQETLTKLESVLTQDQLKKFEALTDRPEEPRPPPPAPPVL
jgi:FMN phosphatase YigB (HAD superfamily)